MQVVYSSTLILISSFAFTCCEGALPEHRWVFVLTDLNHEQTPTAKNTLGYLDTIKLLDDIQELKIWQTQAYNGVIIQDTFMGATSAQSEEYRTRLTQLAEEGRQRNIEIIPMVFTNGSLLLGKNIDHAEGIPAIDCPFKVVDSDEGLIAIPVQREMVENHDFLTGFTTNDWNVFETNLFKGERVSIDPETEFVGKLSKPVGQEGFAKIFQEVSLAPFRQYELRCKVKPMQKKHSDAFYITANVKLDRQGQVQKNLLIHNMNQPVNGEREVAEDVWYEHRVIFNTCEFKTLELAFNLDVSKAHASSAKDHELTFLIDDVQIVNLGGFNLLRPNEYPVTVKNSKNGKTYNEGVDYEWWTDSVLYKFLDNYSAIEARTTDSGPSKHVPPPIKIKTGSSIEKDDELSVSFHHGMTMDNLAIHTPYCLNREGVFDSFQQQLQIVHDRMKPKFWILDYDEIRVASQCPLCRDKTPAQLLGNHLQRNTEIIRDIVGTEPQLFTLNDMFDPFHNAVPVEKKNSFYPYVHGTWQESWKYIPKDIGIYNWNGEEALEPSLQHFNQLNKPQIYAGFYDVEDDEFDGKVRTNLEAAKQQNVLGITYATYERDYCKLEAFKELVEEIWGAN